MDPNSNIRPDDAAALVYKLVDDRRKRNTDRRCIAMQPEQSGIRLLRAFEPRQGASLEAGSSLHISQRKAEQFAPTSQRINRHLQLTLHRLSRLLAKLAFGKNLIPFRLRLFSRILESLSLIWREITEDTFAAGECCLAKRYPMNSRSVAHSSTVRGWLLVASRKVPLAQVGPMYCVIRGAHSCEPTQAELIYYIDGIESRRSVFLPHGISPDSNEVAVERQAGRARE